jgi:RNA polymerase sigma-70 factor, ECF subfamily
MNTTPVSLLERLCTSTSDEDWRRLVALYSPLLRAWLFKLQVPDGEVDDLIQEVMSVVIKEIPQFRHSRQRGAFRHWLRTVAVHRVRHQRRQRNGSPLKTDVDLDQLDDPSSELSRQWERDHQDHVARKLMDLLEPEFTPSTWAAFRRQVIDGVRAGEVATELGLTLNAALIAKCRVLRRIREESTGLLD